MPQTTQAAAHYRMGTPVTKCGNCLHYNIGLGSFVFGRCTKVTGQITTFGLCDMYERIRNPFPIALTHEEMEELENWYWERAAEKGINMPPSKHSDFVPLPQSNE